MLFYTESVAGNWWPEGRQDLATYGELSVIDNTFTLKVRGSLGYELGSDDKYDVTLHGQLHTGELLTVHASFCSLLGVEKVMVPENTGQKDRYSSVWLSSTIFMGTHTTRSELNAIKRVLLASRAFNSWMHREVVSFPTRTESGSLVVATMVHPVFEAKLTEAKVAIFKDIKYSKKPNIGIFQGEDKIQIEFKKGITIEHIYEKYAEPFEALLALLTGTSLQYADMYAAVPCTTKQKYVDALLCRPWSKPKSDADTAFILDNSPVHPNDLNFQKLLVRWFKVYPDFSRVLDKIWSLRGASSLDHQGVDAAAALEGLGSILKIKGVKNKQLVESVSNAVNEFPDEYRGRVRNLLGPVNSIPPKDMIKAILDRLPEDAYSDIIPDVHLWVTYLLKERNTTAHAIARREALELEKLKWAIAAADWCATLTILSILQIYATNYTFPEYRSTSPKRTQLQTTVKQLGM